LPLSACQIIRSKFPISTKDHERCGRSEILAQVWKEGQRFELLIITQVLPDEPEYLRQKADLGGRDWRQRERLRSENFVEIEPAKAGADSFVAGYLGDVLTK
jgi:hypothetical protein